MKKKFLGISVLAVCIAFLVGFLIGHDEGSSKVPDIVYAPTFYATITEVDDSLLTVEGLDINQINHRGTYWLHLDPETQLKWRGTDLEWNDLRPGLTVSVAYSGMILESFPAQIPKIFCVEVLDDVLESEAQPTTPASELSAQETAQRAYEQILGALGSIYPAEFADAYYREPMLVICLTDISTEMQKKYCSMSDTPHILEFQQVEYSHNDLSELQNAVIKTENLVWSSVGIDIKANRVSVGIPDISKKEESLALIVDQLPSSLKNRFSEYPIAFEEESFVTLD